MTRLGTFVNRARGFMGVPTTTEVLPGSFVSIVLKADQPTGREVQGQVQRILTQGNHPRGIKVRLQDGRIGRVQRMMGGYPPADRHQLQSDSPSNNFPALRRDENQSSRFGGSHFPGRVPYYASQYSDVRYDENAAKPAEEVDLMAYVKPQKQKRRKQQQSNEEISKEISDAANIMCPVCEQFEGDETAVAHHVQSHFDEAGTV